MKILILGGQGWLGGMFSAFLKSQEIEVIENNWELNTITDLLDCDVVVNFAAKANIDWCEKNKEETFKSNVLGAVHIAKLCKKANAKYVFLSSGCILKSDNENDVQYEDGTPHPRCFYTETKLMAERVIMEVCPNALIARIRLCISVVPHPRNALNKLLNYKKLIDCQESVTIIEDFIPRFLELIKEDAKGIYHFINEGHISPAEIGDLIGHSFERFTKADLDKQVALENKAPRTSTILGTRYSYLPPIRERIEEVVEKWKSYV